MFTNNYRVFTQCESVGNIYDFAMYVVCCGTRCLVGGKRLDENSLFERKNEY